jgi:hypothetical protein
MYGQNKSRLHLICVHAVVHQPLTHDMPSPKSAQKDVLRHILGDKRRARRVDCILFGCGKPSRVWTGSSVWPTPEA